MHTAETDVGQIRDRFETGLVVQSDLLAAEVQLAEFRQQEVQAAGDLVTAYAFLNTALGLPVQTPQKVTNPPVEKTFSRSRARGADPARPATPAGLCPG